jgi:hypothetical protein
MSDIHNLKNYPYLATLRRRQAELAERMTVREYYDLVKAGDIDKLDAPTNVPGEPRVQDQEGRILTPLRDLLIRPTINVKRKPLDFAEPPGLHTVDYEEKINQAKEKRRAVLEERYGFRRPLPGPGLRNAQPLEDPLHKRFEPSSTPVSENQYGSLVGVLPPSPRATAAKFADSPTDALKGSPKSSVSNEHGRLGAQISSLLGLEAEEPPSNRYSSRQGKKKKEKSRNIDDPVDIEAELRRGDY